MKPPKPIISPVNLEYLDRGREHSDWCDRCGQEVLLVYRGEWKALEPMDLFKTKLHQCKPKETK